MSFDNTSTTSQSNIGSSAQGTGIPSAANNPYTTNFSPNMNMNSVAGGQGSADASQISTPRFPISKKSKFPWKIIFGVLLLVMLIGGGGAGYYLTQMNQDVRQQASQQQGFSYETRNTNQDTWATIPVGQLCQESVQCVSNNCVGGTCAQIECWEKPQTGACTKVQDIFAAPSQCISTPNRYSSKAACASATYIDGSANGGTSGNTALGCWRVTGDSCVQNKIPAGTTQECNSALGNYPTKAQCDVKIPGYCSTEVECPIGQACNLTTNRCGNIPTTGTGGNTSLGCWKVSGDSCVQNEIPAGTTQACNSQLGNYSTKSQCEVRIPGYCSTEVECPTGQACNLTTNRCGNIPTTGTGGGTTLGCWRYSDTSKDCSQNVIPNGSTQQCNMSIGNYNDQFTCRKVNGILPNFAICSANENCSSKNCISQDGTNNKVCYPASSTETGTNNQVTTTTTATCTSIGAGVGACLNGKSCTIQDITLNRSATGAPCGSNGQIYACWNRSGTSCVSILSSNQSCNPSLGSYPSESTCKSTINCRTAGEGTCLNGKTCTGDDFDKSRTVASGLSCGAGAGGNSPKLCYEIKNNTCVSTASNFLGLCNTFTQYTSLNTCKTALENKNNNSDKNVTTSVCCKAPSGVVGLNSAESCNEDLGYQVVDANQCVPTTGGGNTGTGGNNTQCLADLAACGSERGLSDTCCGTAICQGYSGSRRCENPGLTGDQICGAGSTCTGWAGFKCDALHTSPSAPGGQLVCEQNGQSFADKNAALSYAGQCGQIDKVCVGGANAGKLCGEFNIINNNCGVPPVPTPTPTPTPPVVLSCDSNCTTNEQCQSVDSRFTCHAVGGGVSKCRLATNTASALCQPAVGPMCLSLTKTNVTDATRTTPKLGDAISLTCGEVPLATRYIFRVVQPDGTILDLKGTGRTSEPFLISKVGHYTAQCQICTGAEASTCLPYEPVK